jgi:FtsP/CotA-like multicopper oxidase with cupredoxin domain
VTVINNLGCNGTSIHWHGIRMLNNNVNDGANGVTECPIPPGGSKKYKFLAEQYGTTWYHSHYSVQYANGVVGSMVIRGPASLPYDVDLGPFPISDYYYRSADAQAEDLEAPPGIAPPSDNILFNGTHVDETGQGSYYRVKLQPGKRHLLRIINPSVDNTFTVSLVDHDMTVIATDLVPVNAFTASSLFVGLGQRYDVTIDASKTPGNYWFNVTLSGTNACGVVRTGMQNTPPAAIFQYSNAAPALPTKLGTRPPEYNCEDRTNFVPIVKRNTNTNTFAFNDTNDINVTVAVKQWNNAPRVYWNVHGHDMNITWDEPTLEYVAKGNLNFPEMYNVHRVDNKGQWSFWVIENLLGVPHPMHLHGHDFIILGRSPAYPDPLSNPNVRRFNASSDLAGLQWNNPIRRDTTMLPASGWLVVAFKVDNPGAWLFHCHIAWHVGQGLSLQFLERVSDIPGTVSVNQIEPNCGAWTTYYEGSTCKQRDSGLKKLKRSDPSQY